MKIEYEAMFGDINKEDMRRKLTDVGAILVRSEFLQKRIVFSMPKGHEIKGGWIRVRDEGNRITMTLKVVDGDTIENQKETLLEIDDISQAQEFLIMLGCEKKSYQENKRELWKLHNTEVTIDEWPFLEPFVEIEGDSEQSVQEAATLLSFDYSNALFGTVTIFYSRKYGISEAVIGNETPQIIFEGENPFMNRAGL
jgi:adenylate cyclase class 2